MCFHRDGVEDLDRNRGDFFLLRDNFDEFDVGEQPRVAISD